MKVCVPEISWHNCEPVYSIHMCPTADPNGFYYVATAAADRLIRIWKIHVESNQSVANPVQVNFVAEFTVHQSSVNVVRFSPNGKYLISGSDDRSLVLWEVGSFDVKSSGENEEDTTEARDIWPVKRMLRGHLEGVYDLAWSPCSTRVASASVDNSVIVWDITNGNKLAVLREARSYVQGVAWDPKNEFVVTLSSDRHARFYSIAKTFQCVSRLHQAAQVVGSTGPTTPAPPLFADDMVTRSFFRRAGFSPDGRFAILSGGVIEVPTAQKSAGKNSDAASDKTEKDNKKDAMEVVEVKVPPPPTPTPTPTNGSSSQAGSTQRHAAHLIALGKSARPGKPILSWPSPRRAIIGAAFCPLTFEPTHTGAKKRDVEGVPVPVGGNKIRRRFVAALVAADALILVETSRTCRPIGYIGGLHLDQLTDACWSADGRLLMSCSTDGYCTMVVFGQNELGTPIVVQQPQQVPIEKPCEPNNTQTASTEPEPAKTEVPAAKTTSESSGKRRIAPLLVAEPKSEGNPPVSSSTFFGVPSEPETSKSSFASEGIPSTASSVISTNASSKMEVDAAPEGGAKSGVVQQQPVSILIPRRRVSLTTVSSLPGGGSADALPLQNGATVSSSTTN